MPTLSRFPVLLIASCAAALLAGCGGTGTAQEPVGSKFGPPTPDNASVALTAVADETRIALTWTRTAPVAGVAKWVLYRAGEDGKYAPLYEVPGGEPTTSAIVTGLATGQDYRIFLAGLTTGGAIAADGDRVAASVETTVTTGAPQHSAGKDALIGSYDSPNVMGFDNNRIVLLVQDGSDLVAAVSTDRGATFKPAEDWIDTGVDKLKAVADPARGVIVACYQKQGTGVTIATSTDRGATFTTQKLADDEGPNCSVALGVDGAFLVVAEAPDANEVRVHRSEDGVAFGPAVVAAKTSSITGSGSRVAIAADPLRRDFSGKSLEMVYVAFVQKGSGGSTDDDVLVTASEDGGRSFRMDGDQPQAFLVHQPSTAVQRNPSLAVDPENGVLWVAWEDRKANTISLARSDDYCTTAPAGRIDTWQVGKELNVPRFNPSLRIGAGGKIYVAFAAGSAANKTFPYLTRFDMTLKGGVGACEPPQPGAAVSLQLSTTTMTGSPTVKESAGPFFGADPLISDYVVWMSKVKDPPLFGNPQLSIAP